MVMLKSTRRPLMVVAPRAMLLLLAAALSLHADQFGDFTYTDNGSYITITDYPTSASGAIEIPSTINAKPVTEIGDYAFNDCLGLISVTIPDSVTSIGHAAFSECNGLTSLTFNGSAPSMGSVVFDGAANGFTVYYFDGNAGFTSPTWLGYGSAAIPSALTYVDSGTSITITACDPGVTGYLAIPAMVFGKPVTRIGAHAFGGCSGLTNVTVPSSVTSIGEFGFSGCAGLSGVTFASPASVTNIGNSAFSSCIGFTTVTIPSSVVSIGDLAFGGCSGLVSALFAGSAPAMGASVFDGSANGFTVYFSNIASGFTSPSWHTYPTTTLGGGIFRVSNAEDSGAGSLRAALDASNIAAGTAEMNLADVTGTIPLLSPLPEITGDAILTGPGAAALTVSGGGLVQILSVAAGSTVKISGLEFADGFAGNNRNGAAIRNQGTLILDGCSMSSNRTLGGNGGAIYNEGNLTLRECRNLLLAGGP